MSQKLMILILAINILKTLSQREQNFCQKFLKNNNTIDYQYEHQMSTGSLMYFIIGHDYWAVDTDYRLEVTIDLKGGRSEWFGRDYNGGFSLWWPKLNAYISGLGRSRWPFRVEWGLFDKYSKTGLSYVNRSLPSIPVQSDVFNNTNYFKSSICVSGKNKLSLFDRIRSRNPFPRYYYQFNFDGHFFWKFNTIWDPNRPHINVFDEERDVISFIITGKYPIEDWKMVHIFVEGEAIKYCMSSSDNRIQTKCSDKIFKTLVDCSIETKTSNIFIIVGVIVALVITIGVVLFAIYWCCYRGKSSGTIIVGKPSGSTQSTQQRFITETSKVSSPSFTSSPVSGSSITSTKESFKRKSPKTKDKSPKKTNKT